MTAQTEKYDAVVAINVDVQNDFCPGGSLAVPEGDQVVPRLNNINRWVRDQNGLVVFTRDWHPEDTTHFGKWPRHCVQYRSGAAFHDDLELNDPTEHFDGPGRDLIVSKGIGKTEDGYSGWEGVAMADHGDHRDGYTGHQEPTHLGGILYYFQHGLYPNARNLEKQGLPVKHNRLAIIIGGLATDYCDRATTLDAVDYARKTNRRFEQKKIGIFVVADAMRGVDIQPGDSDRALQEMQAAGAIMTATEDILAGRVLEIAR